MNSFLATHENVDTLGALHNDFRCLVEAASCRNRQIEFNSEEMRMTGASVARSLALHFDIYWQAAQSAPSGPVDVIDLFCGCGGMSAGFRAVNGIHPLFHFALASDIDPVANATYELNLGRKPVHRDVSELARNSNDLKNLLETSGRRSDAPLVLIGCAPCQGFSSHRNAAGSQDVRNSLFVDFAKIATLLRPDAIVVENVPELLTNRYWPYLESARTMLEDAGYYTHLSVHNMAEFGVPQERFRALLLAMPKRFRAPEGFLHRADFRTVRQAIESLPPIHAGERLTSDPMHFTAGHGPSTIETIRAVPKDGGNRPANVGPACLRRIFERQGKSAYEDVYGRLAWDKPAITITAYARNPASGRFVHPTQDRGLSVREAALLQSFPRDYRFEGSLDQKFRQIGNAVPPLFAAYLAVHILGELVSPEPEKMNGGITEPMGTSFSRIIPALKAGYRKQPAATFTAGT